jgi:3-methyl-2-oxobutanoate hydroxymethyltransferase
MSRVSIDQLMAMKRAGEKIAMVTAYDYTAAVIADRAGLPLLLVGDSLGMVMQGYETTLPVTIDDMVRYAGAVVRGAKRAMVVGDLPFLAYSDEAAAVRASGRLMQEAGVQAVKLEGAGGSLPIVSRLVELGVPVMGHLGFTPQSTHQIGIKVQAKDVAGARKLIADAEALEAAGCFALVLELVPASLAQAVSQRLAIPVIGLYGDKPPRHAKRFAEIGSAVETALIAYRGEVEAGAFPTKSNSSGMDGAVLAQALAVPKDD